MKDTRYISIGYGNDFTGPTHILSQIVTLLAHCVKSDNLPLEFGIRADESPSQLAAAEANKMVRAILQSGQVATKPPEE